MEHTVVVLVLTLMVISAAACLAPRLGVPAQLILVVAGIGISVLPSMSSMALGAQRNALLDARDDGMFDDEQLRVAVRDVDVDELVLMLRDNQNQAG